MDKFSILHISDIHKIAGVEYEPLFQSLRRDLEAMTTYERIVAPSFVVVSGDLIQGGYTEQDIREQYNEVESFLAAISIRATAREPVCVRSGRLCGAIAAQSLKRGNQLIKNYWLLA